MKKCGCLLDPRNCSFNGSIKTSCIPNQAVLNSKTDCEDMSDEGCPSLEFYSPVGVTVNSCTDNASLSYLLDLNATIAKRPNLACTEVQFACKKDENCCSTETWCGDSRYHPLFCDDGKMFFAQHWCDGKKHCEDGSDEVYHLPGFECKPRRGIQPNIASCVLPQRNLYTSLPFCEYNQNLCALEGGRCFQCFDGMYINSASQVCDGEIDCYDLTDECLCENKTICNDVLGDSRERCGVNKLLCYGECVDMDKAVICNTSFACEGDRNSKYCAAYLPSNETDFKCPKGVKVKACDGISECLNREDECDRTCANQTHFCSVDIACHKKLFFLVDNRYCDGKPSNIKGCPFGFDETNCTNRFYCTNDSLENISKKRVCNGWIDCSNGEDEAMKRCNSTRFYCLNKGVPLSVGIPRVENGIKECSDGSDECPPNSNRTSLFSNAFEMIGNPFLLAMFWIMGIFAIFGNIVMFIGSVKKFKASTKPLTSCSLWFVINLSIAGFLMGIYLIAIAIKAAEFSKLYCYFDTDWRTSDTCDFLGALVLISCEATAFMMTITTTFRLITILKPFKARSVKPAWSWVATIAAWCFAIILGITPTFNTSSGYFVTAIWFPNHFYAAQSISKSNFEQLACDIITLKSNGTCGGLTWAETKELVTSSFDYLKIKGEFGYFGETSVCLPRLYEKEVEGKRLVQFCCKKQRRRSQIIRDRRVIVVANKVPFNF
uniref:low-density lipoprotein receptor-related protein 1B-like n=1 Tax=Ciona intestinalis TaxID=7719 RepID=UPI000EF4CAF2|nr:low-density lipoprotein receptor-related protein 1B-like [Ciona intestinalis]|eukprot:XP_026692278.1 low-density lipoprotein receptor-related protein 1B-like [Ciona intestinalis]